MNCYIYDLETFPNYFSCAVEDYRSGERWFFEISDYADDRKEMFDFFTKQDKYFLVGYNNNFFDNLILNSFLSNPSTFTAEKAKQIATDIIDCQRSNGNIFYPNEERWNYLSKLYTKDHQHYKPIDLMSMLFSKMHRVSLKVLEVYIDWHDVRDLPFPHDHVVQEEDREEIKSYNFNDVAATKKIFQLKKNDANLRHEINETFDFDCYSKDPVNLGVGLFLKQYCEANNTNEKAIKESIREKEYLDFSEIILPSIHFKSKVFRDFLEMLKSKRIKNTKGELSYKFEFGDVVYSFGTGGIHSKDKPQVVYPIEGGLLIDADVASLYPSLIIENGFVPKHLGQSFLDAYDNLKKERIKAKREGNKLINATYKLSLNGTYGNLINQYSWLYDREAAMKVTLNGQLQIAMITERLSLAGFQIDSFNTDGFTTFVPYERIEEYFKLCREWEKETRLELEWNLYDKVVRRDVNAYFARYNSNEQEIEYLKPYISNGNFEDIKSVKGKIKEKGFMATEAEFSDRVKGYGNLIVKKALKEHFFGTTPFDEFIRNHKNIYDFCKMQNVDKRSKVYWGNEEVQRINRVYVSNSADARDFYKVTSKGVKSSIIANRLVMLYNQAKDEFPTDIDYGYYIQETRKNIDNIEVQQTTLF